MTELPPEIGKLMQLETLILGTFDRQKREWIGNQLTDLPDEISQLTNLIKLDIGGNQITKIPNSFARLIN